jgi:hypothetical protein
VRQKVYRLRANGALQKTGLLTDTLCVSIPMQLALCSMALGPQIMGAASEAAVVTLSSMEEVGKAEELDLVRSATICIELSIGKCVCAECQKIMKTIARLFLELHTKKSAMIYWFIWFIVF